jgi:transcriptional regulator with XRE-family HTH domain
MLESPAGARAAPPVPVAAVSYAPDRYGRKPYLTGLGGTVAEVIIGQQLRNLRGDEKQADLVARLRASGCPALENLTQQRYSDWEGGSRPPYEALVALADFWGVRLRWLVTGEGTKRPRQEGEAEKILAQIRELVAEPKPASVPEEVRRQALASVDAAKEFQAQEQDPGQVLRLKAAGDKE